MVIPTSYQKVTDWNTEFLAAFPSTPYYTDSAGTTPVTALEQAVGKQLDLSGRGTHAIQATSANRGTYKNDSGIKSILYNGTNSSMSCSTEGGASTAAFFCIGFKTTLAGAAQTIWSDRTGNTGLKLEITSGNVIQFSGGNGTSIDLATGDAVTLSTYYVVTAIYDGTNLSVQLNNATPVAAPCVLSAGTAGFNVGKDNSASSGFFKGNIAPMIYIKNDIQSTTQIIQAKKWVGTKIGLVL